MFKEQIKDDLSFIYLDIIMLEAAKIMSQYSVVIKG